MAYHGANKDLHQFFENFIGRSVIMRDHPVIERVERFGYPNVIIQPEHAGSDYFGDEILDGDVVVEYDGDVILKENLERFLSEELDFVFKTI